MRQYLSKLKSASRSLLDGNLFGLPKRDLEAGLLGQKPFMLTVEDGVVPLSFRRGTTDTLIVNFHGAVDKTRRTLPVFPQHNRFNAPSPHQLAISDPTMLVEGDFGVCWYAGHEGFDTQAAILRIIADCLPILKVQQVIFMGGSAGGFAALHASFHFADSYAVVAGAQTNLDRYSLSRKPGYRKAVWPSLPPKSPLAEVTGANLCKLYDTPMTNNVVMLYSAGDSVHVEKHMLPFAAVMARHPSDRFVLESGFWGVEGHSGAVPPLLLNDWLRAIIRNPGASPTSLLPYVHEIRIARGVAPGEKGSFVISDDPEEAKPAAPPPKAAAGFAQRDVETAARLAKLMAGPGGPK
ncbi:hypothetical protein [Paracoccus xiamenensis]|uniref:hypothetical protein n=1 Tax=Paracoccus xiamenensis TaxID=2714901 RepID=UPI00140C7869|nr:hypothetical protein [Paracoccus xiamenensis]NHF74028.1 hypothetical protein [Paracoccus xiamenensis]